MNDGLKYQPKQVENKTKEIKEKAQNEITTKAQKESAKKTYKKTQKLLDKYDKELETSKEEYNKKLSNEFKNAGVSYQNKFEDISKKKLSSNPEENFNALIQNQDMINTNKKAANIINNNMSDEQKKIDETYDKWKVANYLNNVARVESEDSTLFDKTLGVPVRAVKDFSSTLLGTGDDNTLVDEKGNKTFLPSYNDLKHQKVRDSYNTGVGRFLSDVVYNTSKIEAAGLVDSFTGGIGGKAMYWSDMAADNFKNAKNQGYSNEQAAANTLISTGSEFLTEKLLGGFSKKLTGGKVSEVQKGISNSVNKVISNPKVANIIGSMGSEGIEELTQEWIDALNRKITLGEDIDLEQTLKDSLYSFAVGAGSAGLSTGVNNAEGIQTQQNVESMKKLINNLQEEKANTNSKMIKDTIDENIKQAQNYVNNPFKNDYVKTIDNIYTNDVSTPMEKTAIQKVQSLNDVERQALVDITNKRKSGQPLTENDLATVNYLNKRDSIGNFTDALRNTKESQLQIRPQEAQNQAVDEEIEETRPTIQEEQKTSKKEVKTPIKEETKIEEKTPKKKQETKVQENEVKNVNGKRMYNGINYGAERYKNLSDNDIKTLDTIYRKQRNKETLTSEDRTQLDYLKRKSQGIKNPELKTNNTFEDLKSDYSKYYKKANLDNFDYTMLDKAKETIQANKQGRRTKQEWLDIAQNIGSQATNMDSEALKKYAMESFKAAAPNQTENLNRQGQKYVKFGIDEWVNKVYEGAGVGSKIENNQNQSNIETKEQDNRPEWTKSEQGIKEHMEKIADTLGKNGKLTESQKQELIDSALEMGGYKQENTEKSSKREELYENKQSGEETLKINDDGTTEMIDEEKPQILDKMPKNGKPLKQKLKDMWYKFRHHITDHQAGIYDLSREFRNPTLMHRADAIQSSDSLAQNMTGLRQTNLTGQEFKNFTNYDEISKLNKQIENIQNNSSLSSEEKSNKINKLKEKIESNKNITMGFEKAYDLHKDIPVKAKNEFLVHELNLDRLKQGTDQFGFEESESENKIKELKKKYPEIENWAQNIWTYQKNQLQNMVDGGLISQQWANEFMENTPHYVRIQRNIPKMSAPLSYVNNNVSINNQIQKVKGGSYDIMPIKETAAGYTQQVMRAIRLNQFGQELAKTIGVGSTDEKISSLDESFGINPDILSKDGNNYNLTIFHNGQAMSIPINEKIYDSLQPRDLREAPVLSHISKFQREVLTNKNPYFAATNAVKDAGDMFLYSKFPMYKSLGTYLELFGGRTGGRLINKLNNTNKTTASDWVKLYENIGGQANSYFNNGKFESNKNALQKGYEKVLSPIEKGNEFIESMPRITEFVNTIRSNGYTLENGELVPKNGKTPKKSVEDTLSEALYNSAEVTTNFKRGGTWAKNLDRNGVTFFNASIQGASKLGRTFTEAFGDAKNGDYKAAKRLISRAMTLGLAPALISNVMYKDDDEYKDLPDYVKEQYYLFKGKDGVWIRIPKGRAVSIFENAAKRTGNTIEGKKDAWKGFDTLVANQVAPNNPIENNVLSPWTAVKDNKAWSGNNIVSDYQNENYNPYMQYDSKTSELSKKAGKALRNTSFEGIPLVGEYLEAIKSPKKLDYILDQYGGVLGDLFLPTMTNYAETEDSTGYSALSNPLKSKFTTDSTLKNKTTSDYYAMKKQITKDSNDDDATNLAKAKGKYLQEYGEVDKHLSSLYAKQREIQNNNKLSDSEKYKQNKEAQQEIIDYMKQVTEEVKNAKEEDGIVTIGNKYYQPSTNDKGKKTMSSISQDKINSAKESELSLKEYSKINSYISNIESDKNANGKAIRGSIKKKAIDYLEEQGYDEDTIRNIITGYGWKY